MKYAGEGETTCTCWCEAGIVIIPVSDVGERTASCGRTDCVDPALVWHPPKSAHRCSECGRDATGEPPRCVLHPKAAVTKRRVAAVAAPEPGYVPPAPVADGPHSRACGFRAHPHGSACHVNCPTCHGCEPV